MQFILQAYILITLIAFPIGSVAFGLFYAKAEGKSKGFGLVVGLLGIVLLVTATYLGTILISGLMAYCSFYTADKKNRSRFVWTILTLLFGPPLFLVLLCFPEKPPSGAGLSLQ